MSKSLVLPGEDSSSENDHGGGPDHQHTSDQKTPKTGVRYLSRGSCGIPEFGERGWLDLSRKSASKFAELYGNSYLEQGQKAAGFIVIPKSTHDVLMSATDELHLMFVDATRFVCEHPELWPSFDYPAAFWPKAVASFQRGDQTLTGRFDFSLTTDKGIKIYEYNTDSASCLFEAGYSQDAWALAAGITVGSSPAAMFEQKLVDAWASMGISSGALVHFLLDVDLEEQYHAAYVSEFAETAGFKVKLCTSVNGFSFDADGNVLDAEKEPVRFIWKTWSYITLLGQWTSESEGPRVTSGQPRLLDICLSDRVMVLEPWWTSIPANKAILPVLWALYPNHPYLLETSWELTEKMKLEGYVAKPISGRVGENVTMHSAHSALVDVETGGRFSKSRNVFQELAPLPNLCGEYVQVNTWAVKGKFGATVLRVDVSPVINVSSEAVCLRVVDDEELSAVLRGVKHVATELK